MIAATFPAATVAWTIGAGLGLCLEFLILRHAWADWRAARGRGEVISMLGRGFSFMAVIRTLLQFGFLVVGLLAMFAPVSWARFVGDVALVILVAGPYLLTVNALITIWIRRRAT
jgi:hypothetical protein